MEQSFLAYLRGRTRSLPQVAVGIGDDAAVLNIGDSSSCKQQLACVDQVIDGVDFLSDQHSLADVGYKAMAINLSDIAAMGGTPTAALVTLSLPETDATRIAGEVYEGILEAAQRYKVAIAGGDISTYNGPLAISITLLGEVQSPWLRSGAVEGDAVFVSGTLGGSLLGRHLRPEPRLELAQTLRELVDVHAAIDISDGFSLDLDRLCASSRVGVELEIERLPISEAALQMSLTSGRTPLEHAWSDGEDFELIFTVNQNDATKLEHANCSEMLTRVGRIVGRTGLWKSTGGGKLQRVFPQGYLHEEAAR